MFYISFSTIGLRKQLDRATISAHASVAVARFAKLTLDCIFRPRLQTLLVPNFSGTVEFEAISASTGASSPSERDSSIDHDCG